jgi:hypothetical protein
MPVIKPAQKHKCNTKQHRYTKQTLNRQNKYEVSGKKEYKRSKR